MTRRERRTVTLGAVLALAIIGYWLVGRPGPEAAESMVADRAALVARLRGLVEQGPEIERALERARQEQRRMRVHLLAESNPNLAGAALSRLVEETARRSGMQLERTQIRNAETVDGALQRISLAVQLSGGIHGLGELLHALESSTRMISIETLRVTSLGRGPESAAAGSPAPLSVDMTVVAYSLPPGAGAPGE